MFRHRHQRKVALLSSRRSFSVTRLTTSRRPIPEDFLSPPSPALAELPPPEAPQTAFLLPTPVYIPVPVWVRLPHQLQPPTANNVIFANLHSRVVTNRATNTISVTNQASHTRTLQPAQVSTGGDWQQRRPGAQRRELPTWTPNVGPALPPSVAELADQGGSPSRLRRERLQGAQRDERRGVPLQQPAQALPTIVPPSSAQAAPNGRPWFGSQRPERQQQQQHRQAQQEQPATAAPQQQPHVSSGRPPQPLAPAAPGRPAKPTQVLSPIVPPSSAQATPNGSPWFGSQRLEQQPHQKSGQAQQEQAAAAARQQQTAAAVRQQQATQAAAAARQRQATRAAAAARQQRAAQAAAAARQQQAAQAAAAARQQKAAQAVQAAAAARQQQQAAQAIAAARGSAARLAHPIGREPIGSIGALP